MGESVGFNCILIDIGNSTGDAAEEYAIYVSDNSEEWGNPVVTGGRGQGLIELGEQNARFVIIEQTGSKSNYWSIHELYLLNADMSDPVLPEKAPELPAAPDGPAGQEEPPAGPAGGTDPDDGESGNAWIYILAAAVIAALAAGVYLMMKRKRR
jgi:hypothetical protein